MSHPMQEVVLDERGVARFRGNRLVQFLYNACAATDLPVRFHWDDGYGDDWRQLSQLIGFSVSGYGDLPYADADQTMIAQARAEELLAMAKESSNG